jgi:hypothetical protein
MGRARKYANDNERKRVWGKKERAAGRRKSLAPWPSPAVFLDGEAYEGVGYCLLQTFDPRTGQVHTTARDRRLSTDECLDHLFALPWALSFGYGLKYDLSNWFADLPRPMLERLRTVGFCYWKQYKLEFIPGKSLKVVDRTRPKGDKIRTVYDLLPFYQKTFLEALKDARVEAPDIIRQGKRLRGTFTAANAAFVSAYNIAELHAMKALFDDLCRTLAAGDCKIRRWFGPGSCARHYAKARGVEVADDQRKAFLDARRDLATAGLETPQYLAERQENPHACAVDAFYGGRFELSQQGCFERVWEYDLASAYPWALSQGMPCFACGGQWRRCEWGDPSARWAVWLASWQPLTTPNKKTPLTWGPLPVRLTRNLAWTSSGLGWYHTVELERAITCLAHKYRFKVAHGWTWEPACDHDPWAWVGAAAAERVACKESNPAKAQCLKLILNSCYGITADKAGVVNGRIPTYHNPYWAGLITARTRARLIEASAVGWDDIIYLATDGVHAKAPLALPTGNALGDWEEPKRAGIPAVFLAPGTYLYGDGKRGKSRGINLGKFSNRLETWQRLYRMTAPHGRINLLDKHFIPFAEAVARCRSRDDEDYRQILNTWVTRQRILSYDLTPRRHPTSDGRWCAPPCEEWLALGQLLLVPADRQVREEEEFASYQPEWAQHKLDASSDA